MSGPASASFASVTISHQTERQIGEAAVDVFRADGYQASANGNQLVFEKEGTRLNSLARDGLVATHEGARTLVRVRMDVVDLGDGSHRLQCQAYMVNNAGDSFFEEEHALANLRSGPYQRLLKKIARKLKGA